MSTSWHQRPAQWVQSSFVASHQHLASFWRKKNIKISWDLVQVGTWYTMYAYHNLIHSPCVYPRPIDSPPGRCLDWVLGHLSFWGFPRLAFQGKSFGRKPCRQGRASSTCPDSAYLHSRVTCPSLIHRIPSVLLSHPVHGKDLKFRYKKIIGSKMNT